MRRGVDEEGHGFMRLHGVSQHQSVSAHAAKGYDNVDQGGENHLTILDVRRKSPLMICFFFFLWTLLIILYSPRLWRLITTSETPIEAVMLSAFASFHLFFWLLTAYFTSIVLFSLISRPLPVVEEDLANARPDVAILYTTCNDFCAEAAYSCLNQDYPNFHLFLLDDSTNGLIRKEVDAFHSLHPQKTTIVRRPTRKGYKPGALNYALCGVASTYPFFAVIDADEKIPSDFLLKTIACLIQNANLSFVQANHAPNSHQKSAFARDIGPTILPFWDIHCRARNRYGFVTYVGHGVVVSHKAWEEVGGFPEIITEDLAFSILLAEKGMRGSFIESVLCYEDFPATYHAFKRQQERYIIGTTQVMNEYMGRIIRKGRIGLIEKIDLLLWCTPLYVPTLCLVFIILCSIGLTGMFGEMKILTFTFFGYQLSLPPIIVLDGRFSQLCTWDFQLLSIIGAFSPAFACLALGLKGKLHALRLLYLSIIPYLSLMVILWEGILRYLITGKTYWPPTGESPSPVLYERHRNLFTINKLRTIGCHSLRVLEIFIGAILAYTSLFSLNIAFFAVSCCILLGYLLDVYGWRNRSIHLASICCFSMILLQMLFNVLLVTNSLGLVPFGFSIHF